MTLGERVRQVRTSQPGKPSQTAFAEMLGVSRGEIANIEGDVLKKPEGKMALLLLICSTFDVRKEWLLNEDGPMQLPARQGDMMEYVNELTADSPSPFAELIRAALIAYVDSDPKDRPILDRFAQSILDKK